MNGDPRGIALTRDGSRAYVVNSDSNTLAVIDTALALTDPAAAVVATIPVGNVAADVALSPDGRWAYVVNQYGNTVSVIDTMTNEVIATLSVEGFYDPRAITAQYSDDTVSALRAAGVSASTLKTAGISAADVYAGGYTPSELKTAGVSAAALKDAGLSAKSLSDAGFTTAELLAAGFTRAELSADGIAVAVPGLPVWALLLLGALLGRTAFWTHRRTRALVPRR